MQAKQWGRKSWPELCTTVFTNSVTYWCDKQYNNKRAGIFFINLGARNTQHSGFCFLLMAEIALQLPQPHAEWSHFVNRQCQNRWVYSRLWVLICFIVSLLALASQNVLFRFSCNKLITRKAANDNISKSLTLPQVCQVTDWLTRLCVIPVFPSKAMRHNSALTTDAVFSALSVSLTSASVWFIQSSRKLDRTGVVNAAVLLS